MFRILTQNDTSYFYDNDAFNPENYQGMLTKQMTFD